MKLLSDALLGFLAGLVITLGATAYLSLESTMAGALMFTVGLFAICSFGWNLFTARAGGISASSPWCGCPTSPEPPPEGRSCASRA